MSTTIFLLIFVSIDLKQTAATLRPNLFTGRQNCPEKCGRA